MVFVYGTLMAGRANHRVLVDLGATLVGEATTARPRRLVDLGPYPALLPEHPELDGAVPVHGEAYDLPPDRLGALDEFEGCPDLYRRESVVVLCAGARRGAWTYVLAGRLPRGAVTIADGRYLGNGHALRATAREVPTDR